MLTEIRVKLILQSFYKKINLEIQILKKYPNIGIQTDLENVRGLISGHYIIYYEITEKEIIIHTIWDNQQNPNNLKIKGWNDKKGNSGCKGR